MTREEWEELYRNYPGDIIEHLIAANDLLSRWAAEVIESLRTELVLREELLAKLKEGK